MTTQNEAAERRCIATREGLGGKPQQCRKPRWAGHPTRYCYVHAIAFGDAKVVDQAAVDLMLAAERRATVERIRAAFRKEDEGAAFIGLMFSSAYAILDEEAARG